MTAPAGPLPGRDLNRPQMVDLARLAAAEAHYADLGYERTPVPWVIGPEAYFATTPDTVANYDTHGGYLVASAEQAFLQLLIDGRRLTRAQATSPCFRDEVHDELHDPYFMKVELIRIDDVSDAALEAMIRDALSFYTQHVPVEALHLGGSEYDIVAAGTGIELGSYGRRTAIGHTWLYGTGCAEPRLAHVLSRHQ